MRSRLPRIYKMKEDPHSNSPSSSDGYTDESPRKSRSTANYDNFGGFSGIRHGFKKPSPLSQNHYPYPLRMSRSRSPTGTSRFEDYRSTGIVDDDSPVAYRPVRFSIPRRGAFDIVSENKIEEEINDHLMTTPGYSRNASAAEHDGPREFPAVAEFGGPGPRLQTIESSLHPVPKISHFGSYQVHGSMKGFNAAFPPSNRDRNDSQPTLLNHPRLISLPPPNSPVQAPSCIISTSTIRSNFTIQEQRYSNYIALHDACLSASTSHLTTLRRYQQIGSNRYHPYSSVSPPSSRSRSERTETLMDNISKICTHMWRKARSDGIAPHRAEAETVRVMRDLYAWGELVVRAFEGGVGEEDDEMDLPMDAKSERWSDLGESEAIRVGESAKNFCECLRDRRAWNTCDNVVKELRDLEGEMGSEDGGIF